jgi:hypothetical protein
MAMLLEMKAFISHKHCQSLMDKWWVGGHPEYGCELEEQVSYSYLALISVLPMLPVLWADSNGSLHCRFANHYLFHGSWGAPQVIVVAASARDELDHCGRISS